MIGRPSKYKRKFVNEVKEYLVTTGRLQKRLPTIESFALRIGVNKTTLYEWKKKHSDFSNALDTLLLHQKVQLIDDGIYGGRNVNATIIRLLLQNNHGFKDRSDQTTNDEKLPTPIYGDQASRYYEKIKP